MSTPERLEPGMNGAAVAADTDASSAGVGGPAQPDSQPRRRLTSRNATCGKCVEARRCFRMCLVCRPSRYQEDEAEASLPLLHIIFRRHDPRPAAQAFLEAFGRAVAAGTVARDRVIPVIRAWRSLSVLSGSDASWGILGGVSRLMGISEMELQEPRAAMAQAPVEDMAQQRLWANTKVQRLGVHSQELQRSTLFTALDDGVSAQLMLILADGTHPVHASNDAFDRLFLSANEMAQASLRHKTLQFLLFAALFEEDDRSSWCQGLVQALFGRADGGATFTRFVKMVDCEGNVALYTLKTMQLSSRHWPHGPATLGTAAAGTGSGGPFPFPSRPPGSYGMLVRLEPVPPTLHLTARPDLVGSAGALSRSPLPAAVGAGGAATSRRGRPARLYAYAYAHRPGASQTASSTRGSEPAASDGASDAAGARAPAQPQPQHLPPVFPSLATIPVPPPKSEEARAAGATEDIFFLSRTEVQGEVVESALRPDDQGPLRRSERSRRQRQPHRQSEEPEPQQQQRRSQRQRQGQRQRRSQRRANEAAAVVGAEPPAQSDPSDGPAPELSPAFDTQQTLAVLAWSQEWPVPVLAAAEIEELEGLFQD